MGMSNPTSKKIPVLKSPPPPPPAPKLCGCCGQRRCKR